MHSCNFLFHFFHSLFPRCPFFTSNHTQPLLLAPSTKMKAISSIGISAIQEQEEQVSKKKFQCSVIPTLHCADTQEWRKRLILAAQHNIVISGNYCGGKALDDLLHLIDKRLEQVPKLQVLLITHPGFLGDHPYALTNPYSNRKLLASLFKKYRSRFYCVESPDIFCQSKKTTNHAKFTIIDYGKFFIMGGSGIKDNFVLTGLDHLTVEQYLKLEKEEQEKLSKNKEEVLLDEDKECMGISKKPIVKMGNFRDQDFVFQGTEAGKKMYRQALFLAYKWDRYIKDGKKGLIAESWELDDLKSIRYPALTDVPCKRLPKIHDGECVLYRMLKRPIPNLTSIHTKIVHFQENVRKVHNVESQFFFLGPEISYANPFTAEMISRVKSAVKEIIIDHVYFQPPKKLLQELIAAVKRGVSLTIVTAGLTKNCPNGQKRFGPKNILHYTRLLESLKKNNEQKRIKIYEFEQNKKGLHKKVVIIDDCILAGSSNMDIKCFEKMGDHDTNFIAKSQELVNQTKRIIREDIRYSRRVKLEIKKGKISSHL